MGSISKFKNQNWWKTPKIKKGGWKKENGQKVRFEGKKGKGNIGIRGCFWPRKSNRANSEGNLRLLFSRAAKPDASPFNMQKI